MRPGRVLHGRYRVEKRLGRGGMAETWRAADTSTNTAVVVKTPHPDWTDATSRGRSWAELLKRFEREGRLLDELDHPGIPRLLHRGGWPSDPYLVMEFIDGPSLRDFAGRHRPLPIGATAAVMVDLVDALTCVHAEGVVHRDVKPSNAIVAMDGMTHLIDFGIAFLTDPDATRYTQAGATPGSPGYLAPEIITASGDATAAADMYSCGCIAFELLAGRPPFTHADGMGFEYQHAHVEAPLVSQFRSGVPEEIVELVAGLLAKKPAERPTGATALQILRRHLPAAGTPAPELLLKPDPTAVHRRASPAARQPGRPDRAGRRAARRQAQRPSRQELSVMVHDAATEIEEYGPGPHAERLAEIMAAVRGAWGLAEPDVAEAQLRCADAARLHGDWPAAGAAYREVERTGRRVSTERMRLLVLEAGFGVAECLIPEGELDRAYAGWSDRTRELTSIEAPPPHLVRRCRDIGLELEERGYRARAGGFPSLPGELHTDSAEP